MSDAAVIKLDGDNADLNAALSESLGALNGWGNKIMGVAKVVGAAFAAKKLFDFGASLVSEAMEAQDGVAMLELTIKNLGGAASMTSEEVQDFAGSIMDFTKFTDDSAIAVQNLFLRLGTLDSDSIKRATVAAADLATVMGTDLEAAGAKIMTALKDPERGIMALKQAGIKFTEEEKNMVKALAEAGREAEAQEIILSKLEGSIGGAAEVAGGTASGSFARLMNALSDAGEAIGGALLPMIEALIPTMFQITDWITGSGVPLVTEFIGTIGSWIESFMAVGSTIVDYLAPIFEVYAAYISELLIPAVVAVIDKLAEWGEEITGGVGPVLTWFADMAIVAFTAVQTVVENFSAVAELALKGFVLAIVQTFEAIKHFLIEGVPAYLAWFGRNWKNVFTDAASLVATVAVNMWENLKNLWEGIKGLFSGNGFKFEMTPLLQGFESVSEELPKIAERAKSDFEKGLEFDVNQLGAQVGDAFDKNLAKNQERFKKQVKEQDDKLNKVTDAKAGEKKTPSFSSPDQLKLAIEAGANAVKDKEKDKEKTKEKEDKGQAAAFEDLLSLSKRITGAAFGDKDPTKVAKDVGEKQTDATNKVVDEQKRTNDIASQQVELMRSIDKKITNVGSLQPA